MNRSDTEIWQLIQSEQIRQEDHLELIASENYTSLEIMEAQGSVLTNKYAEGYPHKRYYGGCEYVDGVEEIAINRLKELFKADYANVQPHSGSQANAAAFMAILEPNDKVLSMSLSHGGHLTHGSHVNFSGKIYDFVFYGVNEKTGLIDYQQVYDLAQEHKPKLILGGFSAYSRIVDWAKFKEIADSVGAYFMVDMAHVAGLIAAGLYPNPIPYADIVTSTTHKTLRGPRGGIILAKDNEEITKKLNSAVFPGTQGGPLMHVIAAKAIAFKEALTDEFKQYQKQVILNAKMMAKTFIEQGYHIVSNGTDNHLLLLDLRSKFLTGKFTESLLDQVNITVNKNVIPGDDKSPFVTSGIRLGTPAVTTRGFGVAESELITNWMCQLLNNVENEGVLNNIKAQVIELCTKFPVYKD